MPKVCLTHMPKVCLTHMISWSDRLGLPLYDTSGDDSVFLPWSWEVQLYLCIHIYTFSLDVISMVPHIQHMFQNHLLLPAKKRIIVYFINSCHLSSHLSLVCLIYCEISIVESLDKGNNIYCFIFYSCSKENNSSVAIVLLRLYMIVCTRRTQAVPVIWEIWRERNCRIFHNLDSSAAMLTCLVVDEANVGRRLTHHTSFCDSNLA